MPLPNHMHESEEPLSFRDAVRFYDSIEDAADLSDADLIALFVYFLTFERGEESVTGSEVRACFKACGLAKPTGGFVKPLDEGGKSTPRKYIKHGANRYKLERSMRETLKERLGRKQPTTQINVAQLDIEQRPKSSVTRQFGDPAELKSREALQREIVEIRHDITEIHRDIAEIRRDLTAIRMSPQERGDIGGNNPPEDMTLIEEPIKQALGSMGAELEKETPDISAFAKAISALLTTITKILSEGFIRAVGGDLYQKMTAKIASVAGSAFQWISLLYG